MIPLFGARISTAVWNLWFLESSLFIFKQLDVLFRDVMGTGNLAFSQFSLLPTQRLNRYCASYPIKYLLRLYAVICYAYYHHFPEVPSSLVQCFQQWYFIIGKLILSEEALATEMTLISFHEDKKSYLWLGLQNATLPTLHYWFLILRPFPENHKTEYTKWADIVAWKRRFLIYMSFVEWGIAGVTVTLLNDTSICLSFTDDAVQKIAWPELESTHCN